MLKTLFVATMRLCRPVAIKHLAHAELRFGAARRGGWLRGQVVRMTDTEREDDFQVISLRDAEKYEVNRFFEEVSR